MNFIIKGPTQNFKGDLIFRVDGKRAIWTKYICSSSLQKIPILILTPIISRIINVGLFYSSTNLQSAINKFSKSSVISRK
nr:hypothetical protein Iba_chr13cCG13770 [Ipomoea batatas]